MATTKQAYRPLDGEEKNLEEFEVLQDRHSQKSTWQNISTIVLSMTTIVFGLHVLLPGSSKTIPANHQSSFLG